MKRAMSHGQAMRSIFGRSRVTHFMCLSFQRQTTPPAWSSWPEIGLNFTSTKPSASAVPVFTHHGKVPLPSCSSTWPRLGAAGSAATVQRGLPRPVTPHVQPAGAAPTVSLSKCTPCAPADTAMAASPMTVGFMASPLASALMPSHASPRVRNARTTMSRSHDEFM